MIFHRYALVFIIFLMVGFVSAQDDVPVPVLQSEDIFADGVTVLERLPVLNYDNEARLLYYFDVETEAWETYPYPDTVEQFYHFRQRSDDTYLLTTRQPVRSIHNLNEDILYQGENHLWLFNPEINTFERPEFRCGTVRALPDEATWRPYRLTTNQPYRLCNTETGDLSTTELPENFEFCAYQDRSYDPDSSPLSPDGNWLILHDCSDHYSQGSIYTFNVQTEELIYIQAYQIWHFRVIQWLNNQKALISLAMTDLPRFDLPAIYRLDVTQPGSLERITTTSFTEHTNEPVQRFTWEITVNHGSDASPLWHHEVYEYVPSTDEIRQILSRQCHGTTYYDCESGISVPNHDNSLIAILDREPGVIPGEMVIYSAASNKAIYHYDNNDLPVQEYLTFSEVKWVTPRILLTSGDGGTRLFIIEDKQTQEIAVSSYGSLQYNLSSDHRFLLDAQTGEVNLLDFQGHRWHNIIKITSSTENVDFVARWIDTNTLDIGEKCQPYNCYYWRISLDDFPLNE